MKFFKNQNQEEIKRFLLRETPSEELDVGLDKKNKPKNNLTQQAKLDELSPDQRKKLQSQLKTLEKEQGSDKKKLETLESQDGDKGVKEHEEAQKSEKIKKLKDTIKERQGKIDKVKEKLGQADAGIKAKAKESGARPRIVKKAVEGVEPGSSEYFKRKEGKIKNALNKPKAEKPKKTAELKKSKEREHEAAGNKRTEASASAQATDGKKLNKVG